MSYRRAKPLPNKSRALWLIFPLALATLIASPRLQAVDAQPAEAKPEEPASDVEIKGEIAGYVKLATQAADQEKWQLAEHFLEIIVNLPAPMADKKKALADIGALYEKKRTFSKAIAIYEKMIAVYPADPDTPELIFKVGTLYREAGAYQRAITRFYTVLNSALQVNGHGLETYRKLTQRAQTEIADTYFLAGENEQAAKFYNLLSRLELAPEEKARVLFKSAHCHYVLGNHDKAIASAQSFLAEFGNDPSAPECRYILASSLKSLKRPKEAFDAVLTLLRTEHAKKGTAPEKWVFWQKKTGNEFANDFYQQGDFTSALTIYQTLAQLNDEPEWQWPVVYQMGLCFERLRLVNRAAEAYKFILDEANKPERASKPLPESCTNLVQMSRWRGEQLAWQHTTETQLSRLLGQPLAPAPIPAIPKSLR
ncbi:MAG: tetratricopeptide repeat protein [Chthoniobacter sp.]|nr:tetratricopeptide repeat protein [Chthoniobacter sp.]